MKKTIVRRQLLTILVAVLLLVALFYNGCSREPRQVVEGSVAADGGVAVSIDERADAASLMKKGLAFERERQYEAAARCYRQAAEQGLSEAQNNLGVLYKDGQGVGQDYGAAAHWFRLAAEQDNTLAQLNLGWLYHAGKGVSQHSDSARYWYLRAATKGHTSAQLNLGILCLQQQDTAVGIYWLRKAVEQGCEGARRVLRAIGDTLAK